jgi:glycosyltransferase involved in cell wall biosynthesis
MSDTDISVPLVSVVIPTCRRSEKLLRAVKSVLAQTYENLQLIVVIDGPEPDTEAQLNRVQDSRLLVLPLPLNVGGAEARNAGVRMARGEWVAFLDDDDEWLPEKIEKQMDIALHCAAAAPIVSSRLVAKTADAEHIWPKRLPSVSEPICEYLLIRKGLTRDDGFVSTITVLTRKSLLVEIPFRSGLKRHQDWDWVLRATRQGGASVHFCPEPLAIWHMEDGNSVSRRPDWQYSLQWINGLRSFVTPRAYAGFLTAHVAWQAANQREWKACLSLLFEVLRHGSPKPADLVRFFGFWLLPIGVRRKLAALIA